ncbi:methyltransferase domain-containing protein [Candidatus Saccharibacteria bacterium]|nr:MAG: methyltransferase domain-containing protein [Candidatus Saccharibacteria bacterium]
MAHNHTHEEAQAEELAFWLSPGAELGEQLKQLTYAPLLGLDFEHDGNSPYVIHKPNKSIIDIGGGPVSLLLKTKATLKTVIDPCSYPAWVRSRYEQNDVRWIKDVAETYQPELAETADEVWLYNVLQHTTDPQKIFENVLRYLKSGGVFRFFDWIETGTNVAHPISLTAEDVHRDMVSAGFTNVAVQTTELHENGAYGKAAYFSIRKD